MNNVLKLQRLNSVKASIKEELKSNYSILCSFEYSNISIAFC